MDYYDWYADELFDLVDPLIGDLNVFSIPVVELDENGKAKVDENGNEIFKIVNFIVVGVETTDDGRVKLITYEEKAETVSADASVAIVKADLANTSGDYDIARDAASAAGAALYDATKGLEEAEEKLNEENGKVVKAREKYNTAKAEYDKAVKALEEAEKALNKALRKSYDEEGKPERDKDGNIIYLGDVADAEKLMPPKSTWFEPKLLSGLFIHDINGIL